jgi:hypothetical protein
MSTERCLCPDPRGFSQVEGGSRNPTSQAGPQIGTGILNGADEFTARLPTVQAPTELRECIEEEVRAMLSAYDGSPRESHTKTRGLERMAFVARWCENPHG